MQEQVWTWVNDGDEYFYDKNEWVRVRVEDEQWIDISPSPPSERGDESTAERKSPYSITVSAFSLCKSNVLNNVGFNVAVWTWASRMVVGQRTCESSALPSRQNLKFHRIIDNQQSTQKKHLHIKDLKCISFTGSIGRIRRTITLSTLERGTSMATSTEEFKHPSFRLTAFYDRCDTTPSLKLFNQRRRRKGGEYCLRTSLVSTRRRGHAFEQSALPNLEHD